RHEGGRGPDLHWGRGSRLEPTDPGPSRNLATRPATASPGLPRRVTRPAAGCARLWRAGAAAAGRGPPRPAGGRGPGSPGGLPSGARAAPRGRRPALPAGGDPPPTAPPNPPRPPCPP